MFFSADAMASIANFFGSQTVQDFVSNPFLMSAVSTMIIIVILIILSDKLEVKEFARTTFFIYLAMVAIMMFNNRGLLARYDTKYSIQSSISPYFGNAEPFDDDVLSFDETSSDPTFPVNFLNL